MAAPGSTTAARPGESLARTLVAASGGLAASLAAAAGIALLLRRVGGGFGPADGGGLLTVAIAGGLLVVGCDAAARAARLPPVWPVVARGGYLLALAALAPPPRLESGAIGAAFAIAVAIAVGIVAAPLVGPGRLRWLQRLRGRTAGWRSAPAPPSTSVARERLDRTASPCPGHLLQHFERYELDGFDCLRGTLALTVPRGARSAHGHVGFCPAFRLTPDVETHTGFDGVEAVVSAAEVVPWGVRIECRLDEPAEEPVEIPVDVFARAAI